MVGLRYRNIDARGIMDAVQTATADPTGTARIRRAYRAKIEMRWRQLRARVRAVIIDQNILGMGTSKFTALSIVASTIPGDGKIRMFQTWLDNALDATVLEHDTTYLDPMIADTYNMAVQRGIRLTKNDVRPAASANAISSLQQLVHVEMQGINEAVSQSLVRIASHAVVDGGNPVDVFRMMADRIEKIGITRSRAMVESLVVKAHATGTLDQFEAAGVQHVGRIPETLPRTRARDGVPLSGGGETRVTSVRGSTRLRDARKTGPGSRISRTQTPSASTIGRIRAAQRKVERLKSVEVLTAGDEDVCPECQDIEDDNPYTINQARSLIPAHPYCRCAFVPVGDARFSPSSGLLAVLGV